MQQFKKVAERYGLVSSEQVKERIIWENLKAVIYHLYDDEESKQILERYDSDFRECEKEQMMKGT